MSDPNIHDSDYWLRWQVFLTGVILLAPAVLFIVFLIKFKPGPLYADYMWKSQWKKLNPLWLLCYRVLAFVTMAVIWANNVRIEGARSFYFYTQWTFTLVTVYFGLATIMSAHGCWEHSKKTSTEVADMKSDVEEGMNGTPASLSRGEKENKLFTEPHSDNGQEVIRKRAGFWGRLMQIIYQVSAGSSVLTDIVHWCILVPFFPSPNGVNTMGVLTHSMNLILLLLDASLNSMPFLCFRVAYFVLWTFIYVAFQWIVHGCCVSWWPYDFLDLNSSWAPLWYLALTGVHVPCFAIYSVIIKVKNSFLPRLFPHSFVPEFKVNWALLFQN